MNLQTPRARPWFIADAPPCQVVRDETGTLVAEFVRPEDARSIVELHNAVLPSTAPPRWRCPKCGSTDVEISLPVWFVETQDLHLQQRDIDGEADPLWWFSNHCEATDTDTPLLAAPEQPSVPTSTVEMHDNEPVPWTAADCELAGGEGWNLFESGGTFQIERDNVPSDERVEPFATEAEAFAHVCGCAAAGSEVHLKALTIHEHYARIVICPVWHDFTVEADFATKPRSPHALRTYLERVDGTLELLAEHPVDDAVQWPKDAAQALIETINATGGLMSLPDGNHAPQGDPEWIDLAESYLTACREKDVKPMIDYRRDALGHWQPPGEDSSDESAVESGAVDVGCSRQSSQNGLTDA
jgi:hypothetical protein